MRIQVRLFLPLALAVGPAGARGSGSDASPPAGFAAIPAGSFEMGDHHGFFDPKHGGDETPIHTVRLDAFAIGIDLPAPSEKPPQPWAYHCFVMQLRCLRR